MIDSPAGLTARGGSWRFLASSQMYPLDQPEARRTCDGSLKSRHLVRPTLRTSIYRAFSFLGSDPHRRMMAARQATLAPRPSTHHISLDMDLGLRGKRVLVTGSTLGIGFATAELLAREGASVVVNGRDPGRVTAAVERLRG